MLLFLYMLFSFLEFCALFLSISVLVSLLLIRFEKWNLHLVGLCYILTWLSSLCVRADIRGELGVELSLLGAYFSPAELQ